jgi:hypothetical protein
MKICIFAFSGLKLGLSDGLPLVQAAQRIIYKHAEKMAESGHDVTIMFHHGEADTARHVPNVRVIETPRRLALFLSRGGFGLGDVLLRVFHVLTNRYDVIHCVAAGHRPAQLIPALVARFFTHATIIDEWWEWMGGKGIASQRKGLGQKIVGWYDTAVELPSKRWSHGVICITTALMQRLPAGTNSIVLRGASESGYLQAFPMRESRETLNLEMNDFIIGMSNLCQGDHEDNTPCLTAIQQAMRFSPQLKLLATGSRDYLASRIEPMFPPNQLIMVGWVEFEMYNRFLSACNVFVLPFPLSLRNKGRWPNKIGDYICLKRPIITNPTGDVEVLLKETEIGALCANTVEGYLGALSDIQTWNVPESGFSAAKKWIPDYSERAGRILQFYQESAAGGR